MNLIVAVDNKWGIGRDGDLLAHVPSDMKYFKEHTYGRAVVMGRRTLESMPGGRGLPGRTNYVLTSNPSFKAENCIVVHSESELFQKLSEHNPDDVYLIGGATIYNRFYRLCDRLYVTKMDADLSADTFITDFDKDRDFDMVSESAPVTENGITFRFLIYEKKKKKN